MTSVCAARVVHHSSLELRNKTSRQGREEKGRILVRLVCKNVHEKVEHRTVDFVTRWEW
jgi:hypothetical protein